MPTVTAGLLTKIQFVAIPSTDQDRSLAFYESLGFEKRNDIPWGNGYRWIEVYPPNAPTGIALVPPRHGDPTSVQTGIVLNTDDIDVAHSELRELGVDVDESIARVGARAKIRIGAVETTDPVPPMFYFRDPDGNSLLVVQPS